MFKHPAHGSGLGGEGDNSHCGATEGVVGELATAAREDEFLRVTVLVATLVGVEGRYQTSDLLPPLRDVTLRLIAPQGVMLTGHEREALGNGQYVEFVQGWWAQPV